ncbi:MAG TPA: chalcone isomerase family protein [Burkholderiales bacterium]|nr:chalcone isomerase family protein [Burkholderiales bacterium]
MVSRALALLLLVGSAQAADLEGVRLEERVQVDGQPLQLNGIALRTRMFFKVYVAGLYLPQRVSSAQSAIQGQGPKRIVLVMLRDADADQFCDSIQAGLDANHTDEELRRIRPQVDSLYAKIRNIGEARKGMRIVLDYSSRDAATTLHVDGVPQGDVMRGPEFFQALLRIWLGERPAQPDLKRALLRQTEDLKE